MNASIVFPQALIEEIASVSREAKEAAAVLLCSVFETADGTTRALAQKLFWVADSAYVARTNDSMSIKPEGYIHALGEAEEVGATCLWLHTHPGQGAYPVQSEHDKNVDSQIADLFRLRSNSPYYGAIIFSPRSESIAFTGFLEREGADRKVIDHLWQVGDRWRLVRAFSAEATEIPGQFDRNVRAFGPAIQRALSNLHVGVIGCGGTGSAISEQLVRLGVRHFTLVDPDILSASNTTRVYGSSPKQVGLFKTEVVSTHLHQIAPDVAVTSVNGMITLRSVAEKLIGCDLVFGCTDDNAGRLVLSRLSTYFLIPVIDCGVLLSSDSQDMLTGIDGRVTTLVPGRACLVCRDRIDMARASAELLTPEERVRRVDEGYAPALARTEPAVVAYTTLVAAVAVSELLERLIGYGPEPRPSEVLIRVHEREISTNVANPRQHHYCHPDNGKIGRGLTTPFLEQVWPNE